MMDPREPDHRRIAGYEIAASILFLRDQAARGYWMTWGCYEQECSNTSICR
jgi:hypothetical protein